ncbi:MAG: copper amine oxidase N-terminal domain-containing protein [Candidatus Eremiobacteraeota bacterium]|nr:copper amine oxidase N-terminal domain-containing protein [Candidatus Eremiobacteraeota bacterium]
MKTIAAALCVFALGATATARPARIIQVSINDRPMEMQAVLSSDTVLMPMRPLFAALGASVQYDGKRHSIYARSGTHRIALVLGHHGSRLIHFRTYVPLRYVAQTLGALVDYDASTRSVAIYGGPPAPKHSVSLAVPSLVNRHPAPGEHVGIGYTISATINSPGGPLELSSLRMYLDGINVANQATFDGATLLYTPFRQLDYGRHAVLVEGTDNGGRSFRSQWWWFQNIARSYTTYGGYSNYGGGINGFHFYSGGPLTYFAGDFIQLVLIAPAGGNAFLRLCGLPQVFNFNYYPRLHHYMVSLPAPRGYYLPNCSVTAFYNGFNGLRTVIPLRSRINIFTKTRHALSPAVSPRPVQTPATKAATPSPAKRQTKPVPGDLHSPLAYRR